VSYVSVGLPVEGLMIITATIT